LEVGKSEIAQVMLGTAAYGRNAATGARQDADERAPILTQKKLSQVM